MSFTSVSELLTYALAASYSLYTAASLSTVGITAFAAGSLLTCFSMAAYSMFRLLTRPPAERDE